MKIAFISLNDAADVHQWSGLNFFMAQALEDAGAIVHRISPREAPWSTAMKVRQRWYDATGQDYHAVIEPAALDALGDSARSAIPRDADAVLSVTSLVAAAVGRTPMPHASWDDATNAALDQYYPDYRQMAPVSRRHSEELGQRAARAVDLAIYSSEWAASSARTAYGLTADRVAVVPFGANLHQVPTAAEVDGAIAGRDEAACHLLWMGVDWSRKGGDDALAVTRGLRGAGVAADLTVIGCEPPVREEWLDVRGFVSKATSDGRAELARAFLRSHFLLVPSRAEAFGLVYAEAAAFGVPSVACNTGGVSTIVQDDVSGLLENVPFNTDRALHRLLALLRDRQRYEAMAHAARKHFEPQLNWGVAGRTVLQRLEALVSS